MCISCGSNDMSFNNLCWNCYNQQNYQEWLTDLEVEFERAQEEEQLDSILD